MKAKFKKNDILEENCGCLYRVWSAPKTSNFYIVKLYVNHKGTNHHEEPGFKWKKRDLEKHLKLSAY